ncbi:uncharacterized protein F5891DRAFT_749024 [Suillus fuscotomentosus]|uniref:Uncharacterized protein n=1 Tax=Suillus fuscotomentosus TaxID=1912939 RepID=A0AAD4HR79_9AGAM|nr:uncharacterized protein F5891DRAFT_749024 [Suillus fuscotomentosus]KAG1904574.1 hypothetical protein F5891DRAFT_749024 [Suillus fuscotomentosus]
MATSWNITLNDTSPVFTYYPYYDGFGTGNGWQIWYSETGYNTAFANPGVGISAHITSLPGANVTLSFYGTGIELHGAANCTFDVTVDGIFSSSLSSSSDVLYSSQTLSEGTHTFTLTAHPTSGQQLAFENAVIYIEQAIPQMASYGNTNTTFLDYTGNWSVSTDTHVPGSFFHFTETTGSSVSTTFGGSSAVVLQGIVNWGNWQYTVSLNGTQSVLNASSFWFIPDTTLFYEGGLDPTQNYVLNIADTSEDGNKLAINSVKLYQPQPTTLSSSSKPSNTGEIFGAIVGVVVLLALVVGFLFWRRSQRLKTAILRRNSNLLANEILPRAPAAQFPALATPYTISSATANIRPEKFPLIPIGRSIGVNDSLRERALARGPGSVTSSSSPYSEASNESSGSLSSSARSRQRPLPTPPVGVSSPALSAREVYHSLRPSRLESSVQIPDSEVDRILEIIASRIDMPERILSSPPPQYRS